MKKILIINNHADTMSMIERYLELHEFEAEYVYRAQGQEVIDKVKNFQPDLVILEGGIGHEGPLCERIKSDGINVPVIIMSGPSSEKQSYEDCGADDIIYKPLEPKLLLHKIEKILNSSNPIH